MHGHHHIELQAKAKRGILTWLSGHIWYKNQFLNRLANAHMITYNKNMKSSLGVLGKTKTCYTINSSNDSMFTAHFPSYLTLERKPSGFVYVWLYYIIFEMHVPHFYCIVSFNFVQMNVSMMKTNLLGFCLY